MPTFPQLIQEVLGAVFSYDGKLWRTLRVLVFQPGELTNRYVGGQRSSFIGPLQLFLWLQAITFAAHTAFFDADQGRANQKSLALLVLGVWLAVVLWLTGLKERKVFTHSLIAASHFWAFLMVLLLAEYLLAMPIFRLFARLGWVGGEVPVGKVVTLVAMAVILGYLVLGIRRVYGTALWRPVGVIIGLLAGVILLRGYL